MNFAGDIDQVLVRNLNSVRLVQLIASSGVRRRRTAIHKKFLHSRMRTTPVWVLLKVLLRHFECYLDFLSSFGVLSISAKLRRVVGVGHHLYNQIKKRGLAYVVPADDEIDRKNRVKALPILEALKILR